MKILLISSYDQQGGAGIACMRLVNALKERNDIEVKLLVNTKTIQSPHVESINKNSFQKLLAKLKFYSEAVIFSLFAKNFKYKFSFSMAWFGNKRILNHPWVLEADLIHLHWIHHSFLSLNNIKDLQNLGKPIVWTLHDMWAFTGGCHYSGTCTHYLDTCGNCPFLRYPKPKDLSNKIWYRKSNIYQKLQFITCSNWLAETAKKSGLLKAFPITVISNPIDTEIFKPYSKNFFHDFHLDEKKIHILFGADNVSDERKGISYLIEALQLLKLRYPKFSERIELILFGRKPEPALEKKIPQKINYLGSFKHPEEIAKVYNLASVYIIPSLQDNLPNTVLEALSCGTPVAAFNTGGIPDMIDHKINGYLSRYKSSEDLMEGIVWIVSDKSRCQQLSRSAREKVLKEFSNQKIAKQHFELYREILIS